jgi:hypothetical protein
MKQQYKIGDRCKIEEMPSGVMLRDADGDHVVRVGDCGWLVKISSYPWEAFGAGFPEEAWLIGNAAGGSSMTIVALGLTGTETAAELEALAATFDARQVGQ